MTPRQNAGPTNSEFLAELARAAPAGSWLWVHAFKGPPGEQKAWGGRPYRPDGRIELEVDTWGDCNTYFSVAALVPGQDGDVHRRRGNFSRLLALVVDDADADSLAGDPSWVLQTSPGKAQVGFFLDADDADCADQRLVDALVTGMVKRGLVPADKGGNNAVRYVRLPQGANGKAGGPHPHRMLQWHPRVRYSLADAAGCLGMDLDEVRADLLTRAGPAGAPALPDASDLSHVERLAGWMSDILRGDGIHDADIRLSGNALANGMKDGAAVDWVRALMLLSEAPRDERFDGRYRDVWRSVKTAREKFAPLEQPLSAVADMGIVNAGEHYLLRHEDPFGSDEAPEWVIPGVFDTGLTIIAGQGGVGKTTCLLPLAMVAAGLHGPDDPFAPEYWRHVIYVTEDLEQARRIIRGVVDYGCLGIREEDVRERLHLVCARREDVSATVGAAQALVERYSRHVDGATEHPLVVFDTRSASFEMKDENDNAEMSRIVATLKQGFMGIPVWIVAHTPKPAAGKTDAPETIRGASSAGDDVDHTMFLLMGDGDTRRLKQGKCRFEPKWSELVVRSQTAVVAMKNKRGRDEDVTLRWGITCQPAGEYDLETLKAAAEERKAAEKKAAADAVKARILRAANDAWEAGEPLAKSGLRQKVGGKSAVVSDFVEELLAERQLVEVLIQPEHRQNPNKKAYVVGLTNDERDALVATGNPPAAKLEVPDSWLKVFHTGGDVRPMGTLAQVFGVPGEAQA